MPDIPPESPLPDARPPDAEHRPEDAKPACCQCGQPVLQGQPRWAGDGRDRVWHYACAEEAGLTSKEWFGFGRSP